MRPISLAMIARHGLPALLFCAAAALSFAYLSPGENHEQRGTIRKQSDRFSNIVLTTQHGKPVRFYDDLIRDKAVIINLMYTGCGDICPANSAVLAKVNDLLGQRMGRDIIMLSLSIDPIADTPERLKRYWEAFGAKPGWLFLTGEPAEIDRLRRELGAYDLDPAIDADPAQHSGFITIGNDRTNRWTALPLLMHTPQLMGTILRISREG
ncbi:MAG: SCO family protein [Betaproteobacteria bacterium]|nr:SCO family protein [Betaproteobacteria bacterium]